MNKKFALILVAVLFMAASCNRSAASKTTPESTSNDTGVVTITDHKLNVEIARTVEAQDKGLGDRDSMTEDVGMLFVFSQQGEYAFWMKGMRFGLDFIWIRNNKIVEITPNVPAEPNVSDDALHKYTPSQLIDSVLEVNAGWAARNGIKVGDRADLTSN